MVIVVIVIVIVIMVMVMVMVPVMMPMARNVFAVVPIIPDKVYRAAAGMIFSAVTCPMSLMPRRHMQIYRRTGECWIPVNYNRMHIDQRWTLRDIAEIDLTKESRFTNIHGHADIRRQYRCGGEKEPDQQNTFHTLSLPTGNQRLCIG